MLTSFGGELDEAKAIAVHTDEKIIIVGKTNVTGRNSFALVRYNKDGSLETTFNKKYIVITKLDQGVFPTSIAIQQKNSKILVVGNTDSRFVIIRYNWDGQLDETFNYSGIVKGDFGGCLDSAYSIVLQFDDRIIVAGSSHAWGKTAFGLAAFTDEGAVDDTFNDGQGVIISFTQHLDQAYAVALQEDERLLPQALPKRLQGNHPLR